MKRQRNDEASNIHGKTVKLENEGVKEKVSTTCLKNIAEKALWSIPEVLAESFSVPLPICERFTNLIEDECTLPFIARYRKEAVGNLEIEDLRLMKTTVEELKKVQTKISTIVKTLDSQNLLTESLCETICNAKDLEELETTYAPFKESKKTLAAKAKEAGLEEPALKLLNNSCKVSLQSLVNGKVEGLQDLAKVEAGIKHVIAAFIGKDEDNIAQMNSILDKALVQLHVSKSRSTTKPSPGDAAKFEAYISKSFPVKHIKPHMVLILNRGEDLKALSVKVVFPANVQSDWVSYCQKKYERPETTCPQRRKIIRDSIDDAYNRIVEPRFARKIRAKLTETAHRASIDSFSRNLKHLLLTPPLHNTAVIGLDPGFAHGCKCAAVAPGGSVLHTETFRIDFSNKSYAKQPAAAALKRIIQKFRCCTVALGNGTACRETEQFLSSLIQSGFFLPQDVQYTIINESGASIYSCSPEAREEFPDLDPNVISAISLARRLQDPLTEYIRVSPEHIGVGMYQHDIPVKKLEATLEDVVVECVSFVGVDINTCPLHVLSKVAGLTTLKAKKIIDFRTKNGPFISRQQILDVPSLGPKTFEQCSGFLRILSGSSSCAESEKQAKPKTKSSKTTKKALRGHCPDPLDRTCVHPESYKVANGIIKMFKGDPDQIGHPSFIQQLKTFRSTKTHEEIAVELRESVGKVEQILNSLAQPLQHDLRSEFEKPVFKRGVTSMADLKVGQKLDGQVRNVVDFGAFIDIGVGSDALLHVSAMRGRSTDSFTVGARIAVRIRNVDFSRQRIQLDLDA